MEQNNQSGVFADNFSELEDKYDNQLMSTMTAEDVYRWLKMRGMGSIRGIPRRIYSTDHLEVSDILTTKQESSVAPGNDLIMMKGGSEVTVVSGKNNVWLASSDILLPGPFEPTDKTDVIQEERVEAVTKTIDGVKYKSTKTTTPDKGNIINNREQGNGVEKEDSIQDKSPTDKLPPRVPSLTGLQDEMTKKFEIVAIKMVAGRRNTYYVTFFLGGIRNLHSNSLHGFPVNGASRTVSISFSCHTCNSL
jgi:hypothetical protein